MIDGIMRKLGYINEKKLIDVAIEVYERNESGKAKTNDSFYYCIGNAYAINYIMSKFGIDFSEIIKKRRKAIPESTIAHRTAYADRLLIGANQTRSKRG